MKTRLTLKSFEDLSPELLGSRDHAERGNMGHLETRLKQPLRLPWSMPTARESEPAPAPSRTQERPIILVVDDSKFIRESFSKLLTQENYRVMHAKDGQEALEMLDDQKFDLLLLDLNMPGVDGWEMMHRIARRVANLPIVLITGHSGQREWAGMVGARALLEKPVDPPVLIRTVHEILGDGAHFTEWQMDTEAPFRWHPRRKEDIAGVFAG